MNKNKSINNNIINNEDIINTNIHLSSYTNLNNNTYNDLMEIFKPRNKVDNYEIDIMKKIYKKYQSFKDTKFIEINNNKDENQINSNDNNNLINNQNISSQNKNDNNTDQIIDQNQKEENEPVTKKVKKRIQIKEINKNNSLSSETIENDSIHDFSLDNE